MKVTKNRIHFVRKRTKLFFLNFSRKKLCRQGAKGIIRNMELEIGDPNRRYLFKVQFENGIPLRALTNVWMVRGVKKVNSGCTGETSDTFHL